jgi:hypothetical protein
MELMSEVKNVPNAGICVLSNRRCRCNRVDLPLLKSWETSLQAWMPLVNSTTKIASSHSLRQTETTVHVI